MPPRLICSPAAATLDVGVAGAVATAPVGADVGFGTAAAGCGGLVGGGVAATAKHFPGLGRAQKTTDLTVATIPVTRAQLAADLVPFRALIRAGLPLVMLSNTSYTAFGP